MATKTRKISATLVVTIGREKKYSYPIDNRQGEATKKSANDWFKGQAERIAMFGFWEGDNLHPAHRIALIEITNKQIPEFS